MLRRYGGRRIGDLPGGRFQGNDDAYSIAAWLQHADHDGSLAAFLKPALTMSEQAVAQVEGWILGVRGTDLGAPLKIGNPAH